MPAISPLTLGLRWDWEHNAIRYHSYSASTYSIYDLTDGTEKPYASNIPVDIDDRGKLSQSFNQLLP